MTATSTDGPTISDEALNIIFREARTYSAWLPKPVPDDLLGRIYDLAKMGPTSANSSPGRFVFVRTEQAKARLLPAMAPLNVDNTRSAPVTVIVAYDLEFHEKLPRLFPHSDMRSYFAGKPAFIQENAFRNGTLQGAYMIIAARALGLDCGPMSGFDAEKVNQEFFPDGKWKANFICNLGYGDRSKIKPRSPRLEFDEACKLL